MKNILLIIGLLCVVSCEKNKTYPETPPPGYIIVCDSNGHYGVKMPLSDYVMQKNYDSELMDSYREATIRAWGQYQHIPEKEIMLDWVDCD